MSVPQFLKRAAFFFLMTVCFAAFPAGSALAEEGAAAQEIGPGVLPQLSEEELSGVHITYGAYQDQVGWTETKADNQPLQAAEGSFFSAVRFSLQDKPTGLMGGVSYQVYVTGVGWLDWISDDGEAGGAPQGRSVEAVSVKLTGNLPDYYDVYYAVWQNGDWTPWASNEALAGQVYSGYQIEGLRAAVVPKGSPAPEMTEEIPATETPDSQTSLVDPARPMVALTFDDGPNPSSTGRILDSLQAVGGRATFFMVGERIDASQAVVQRMTALGCETANHTYGHKYLTKLGDSGIRSQVGQTNEKIQAVCGVSPTLVRPPGGFYDQSSLNTLGSMGMSAIMWSVDTLDWKTRNSQKTVDAVLGQVKDGDIVLMHDLYGTTADAAEILIPELVNRGYQLVTVSEMAQCRGGLEPGKVYSHFRP